jgi:C-terminal peptidase prc
MTFAIRKLMGAIMSYQTRLNGLFVAVFFLTSSLAAEPVVGLSPADENSAEVLARHAQAVIDAVLDNHLDPPTRQEMWLAGTKALLAEVGITHRPGLSAEISQLATPGQFAEFAKLLCLEEAVARSGKSGPALRKAFVDGVLAGVPGGARLVPEKELAVEEQIRGNRYVGTGIALRYDENEGYVQIANVIPGGPMERAGGRQGDWILKVDDRDARGITIATMVDLLRGDEGSGVSLVVGPGPDQPRTIVVTRGPVVLETLAGLRKTDEKQWDYSVEPWLPIRCVKVRQINGSTVHDLRVLERQFQADGVQAIILDFRSTAEGDLHHAVLLADALMDGGLIGRLHSQSHVHEFRADRECLFRDWPMAVLVGRETRGAAEWVAAALQDNRAAVLVGEPTAGSAFVRSTVSLSGNLGGVSLNSGIFERPSRRPLQRPANPSDPQPFVESDSHDVTDDHTVSGVTPDLPKLVPPRPGATRPGTRLPRLIGGAAGAVDDRDVLRLAILELRTRTDAGGGRNRQ